MPYARQASLIVHEVDGDSAMLNLSRLNHGPYGLQVTVSAESALTALGLGHLIDDVEREHGPDLDLIVVLDEDVRRRLRDTLDASLGEVRATVPACFAVSL